MRPSIPGQTHSTTPLDQIEIYTMLFHAGRGLSMHEIGQILHRDPSTISRNFRKLQVQIKGTLTYNEDWTPHPSHYQFNFLVRRWILNHYLLFNLISHPEISVRSIAARMKQVEYPFTVKKTVINEAILKMNISTINPIRRPTMTDIHREYRVQFSQNIRTDFRIFLPWLFTDEASINLNCHVQSVRRIPGLIDVQQIYTSETQFADHLMIWGARF